jgi:hypothetical protein
MRHAIAIMSLFVGLGTAHALPEQSHYDVTNESCRGLAFPAAYCTRLATEAYNVDVREFYDVTAHAQSDGNRTTCAAAHWVAARLSGLAFNVRRSLLEYELDDAAVSLGRALHTVQDNCAHHGMSNPEHAWYSLSDTCDDTTLSPDLDPLAVACAQAETASILAGFELQLGDFAIGVAELAAVSQISKENAGRAEKCDFLVEAASWDGKHTGWNRDLARAPLQRAFLSSLWGDTPSTEVCDSTPEAFGDAPRPDVDVSGGTPSCLKVHLYCLGKADSLESEDPTTAPAASGCSTAGGASSAGLALLGLALAMVLAPRSRRRPA